MENIDEEIGFLESLADEVSQAIRRTSGETTIAELRADLTRLRCEIVILRRVRDAWCGQLLTGAV